MRNPNRADSLLKKVDHLSSLLKGELTKKGIMRHWVTAGWKDLLGFENLSRAEDFVSLRHVASSDNVPFTRDGYESMAEAVSKVLNQNSRIAAASPASGSQAGKRQFSFFWRGFTSPNGASRPKFSTSAYNRAKRGRNHPCRGGTGGRQRNQQSHVDVNITYSVACACLFTSCKA